MRWDPLICTFFSLSCLQAETYCFGFLNAHPDRSDLPKARLDEIQAAHLAHMDALARQGHLLAAGPMATQGGPRGIVAYRCQSLDQAIAWTANDPAVVNKRLVIDMHLWNAPSGLGEPLATMIKADPNAKYTMVQLPLIVLRKTARAEAGLPDAALKAHMAHFARLQAQGKIRIAGPFINSPGIIGVFVLPQMDLAAAKALFENEPFMSQGYATVEPHIWYVADEAIPKPATPAP
jgi:uncharacterized protein YciI